VVAHSASGDSKPLSRIGESTRGLGATALFIAPAASFPVRLGGSQRASASTIHIGTGRNHFQDVKIAQRASSVQVLEHPAISLAEKRAGPRAHQESGAAPPLRASQPGCIGSYVRRFLPRSIEASGRTGDVTLDRLPTGARAQGHFDLLGLIPLVDMGGNSGGTTDANASAK
jgi:hypothetical protein